MPRRTLAETNRICAAALCANGYTAPIIARWLGLPEERVPGVLTDAADHAEEGLIAVPGSPTALRRAARKG